MQPIASLAKPLPIRFLMTVLPPTLHRL